MHLHIPNGLSHTVICDNGLGISEMSLKIPTLLGRFKKLEGCLTHDQLPTACLLHVVFVGSDHALIK